MLKTYYVILRKNILLVHISRDLYFVVTHATLARVYELTCVRLTVCLSCLSHVIFLCSRYLLKLLNVEYVTIIYSTFSAVIFYTTDLF